MKIRPLCLLLLAILWVCCAGCGSSAGPGGVAGLGGGPAQSLRILSGSENRSLEPLLKRWGERNRTDVQVEYLGSVDAMLQLAEGATTYDAVWPAQSLWIDLGDRKKVTRYQQSLMRSPVVFGVKKSVARSLGWVGNDVTVEQILRAAEAGKLRFMMTSASQSNSGASAYLGFLYAFAGRPEVLTGAHLERPQVCERIRRILGSVNRSSGSSGWLKDLFVQKYDQYDAMVNYEALVIEANQELIRNGKEPLYAVYPTDGLTLADSPLAYVDHGDAQKEKLFLALQENLLSPEVQREILATGRRVGLSGLDTSAADPALFNPDWGINAKRVLNPIRMPPAPVIREALDLYQTAFRKPSYTVYCLDYSGSMQGQGIADLKAAMRLLLTPSEARRYLLQASAKDVVRVIPFNHAPIADWTASGNGANAQSALFRQIDSLKESGGTDIYTPVMRAFDDLKQVSKLDDYFPAVILMTDGRSNRGGNFATLQQHLQQSGVNADVPVFAVLFGEASEDQLREITTSTFGRIFDGRKDLVRAFREARGYN